jgi:hypothetical protein
VPAEEIRDAFRVEAIGDGANVFLMGAEADNSNIGGVRYRPRKLTNRLTRLNLIQPFVDFSLHSGRGGEPSEYLY